MENRATEILIRAHDGDCALLYIWKTYMKSADQEAAARDLCLTLAQVQAAEEKLQRMGLSDSTPVNQSSTYEIPTVTETPSPVVQQSSGKKVVPMPAEELPEYTSEDIEQAKREDPAFGALQNQFQSMVGRIPNKSDLQRLLGIYRYLGMSPEVIFVLFTYCVETFNAAHGTLPTMNYIERQAFIWVNKGIVTMEQAEEYTEKQKELHAVKNRIKNILEIYDRKLTSNEERGIEAWLEMGFDDDSIRLAYERTVEKTGQRSLPYMSKILQSWHESGLHTAWEIEKKDPSGRNRKGKSPVPAKITFDPNAIDNISITLD